VLAREIDAVLAPQAADDLEPLVGPAAARARVNVERSPFGRQRAADAKGRQQAALGQYVDRSALLGYQHRIAQCQRDNVHAELEAPGPPRECGHDRHALQHRLAAEQAIGLPQRVDATGFAHVDPLPVGSCPRERKLH
jgi:hypothetical protein